MTQHPGPFILNGLLWQAERIVLPWMAERIEGMEGRSFGPASAFGIVGKDGRLCGGVAYSFWFDHPEGGDVQVSAVFLPGCRITRPMWRHLYAYPFLTLGCVRMSAHTTRRNKAARDHLVRTGWKLEGVKPCGFGKQDLILYGLLKTKCRFL